MQFCAFGKAAICLAILAGMARAAFAATYYIASSGADGNDGLTPATALKTLAEAARRAAEGDRILLRRGDVFRESAAFSAQGLEFDAYGPPEADLPAISGSVPITGWQRHNGPVYVAQTDADIGYLFVNGQLMTIARYPNTGWLRTRLWREEAEGRTVVVCPELTAHPRNTDGYWVGANIRWRHHSWWYETRPVVAYAARGELTLGDRSFQRTGPFNWDTRGWGFYLDGKLEELDAPGEWCFDPAERRVYLYPPGGADPNGLLVEGSSLREGLSVRDSAVRNICFRHQKDVGLQIAGRSVVEGCRFEGISQDATVSERGAGGAALRAAPGTHHARVAHNFFLNNLNIGISWNAGRESAGPTVIERNSLTNTGAVPGYGGSGSWHGVGILVASGRDVHVQYNRIECTGYAGILLGSDGNFAEYNVITHAMATMNDGAGIYTNCSRSTIRHNIILDTLGGPESSGTWANISHGIWPEFLRDYRESVIENNTCARSGGDGIFLPNNYECIVRGNVLFDNRRFQLVLTGYDQRHPAGTQQNHTITGNVLYAAQPSQRVLFFDPRHHYGTLRGNYYCNPYTEELIAVGRQWPGMGPGQYLTLAQWQAQYGWADREAKTDLQKLDREPTDQNPAGRAELFINDTEEPKTFPLDGTYRDLDGRQVSGAITVEPFYSKVLILVRRR